MKKINTNFDPNKDSQSPEYWQEMLEEAAGGWRQKVFKRQAREWRRSLHAK